jgi:P27 family predicted phage terminase small subunit
VGARGPIPKPTALKVLEGNPGRRPFNGAEPKPRPVVPACPRWLDSEARREWRRVSGELERLGLLTIVDRAALAGYCQAYARWRQAEEVLSREGTTYETPTGHLRARPEVAIAQRCLGLVRAFCSEFGLTPSARGRMSVGPMPESDEDNPFDV